MSHFSVCLGGFYKSVSIYKSSKKNYFLIIDKLEPLIVLFLIAPFVNIESQI